MRRIWLPITVGLLVGFAPHRSVAQSTASVTVRARVRPPPRPPSPPRSPVALPPVAPGVGPPRATEVVEIFTLDVAGSPLVRVFLCPSGTRIPDESRAACLWRVADGREQLSPSPPRPQQITVHWPDYPQWPAFFAISGAAPRPPGLLPGHYVAYLTIVAEY